MPVLSRPLEHTMPESDEDVQNDVESKTGIRPCLWQIADSYCAPDTYRAIDTLTELRVFYT